MRGYRGLGRVKVSFQVCVISVNHVHFDECIINLIRRMSFNDAKKPGELLIKTLDRRGYSISQYKQFLSAALQVKTIVTYYRPQTKVAILVANDKYRYLSKLATPSIDCDSLAANLKTLGFMVITLKNTASEELKDILIQLFSEIPEDSYCKYNHFN